ncbi:M23 family metallopeptidase [Aurantimonas endophytica]|uniref:Murein DD-endopeptidase MepM/ murein hydrolase activator NlpD n=1 Tax=Aurantimonas endophytica TaxID=1522175 RepID=A0A7W6HI97_9HYPH|nr:M23 family metallopeptidase [Aurantimonas endophytica]MBB4005759.1 murein DD-endopeptidase MepM/ murein hydrolase activator NlpD [Aurantimonas endophytica]MCO6406291.1 peptidoglycan DD-metalloendopeptidase family protein [Aurantimonas endophytica]
MPQDKPFFGDEPALVADRRRRPDRRQVSARWLAGTLLTGLTSTALMGIALSAALDGYHGAARPPGRLANLALPAGSSEKGERVVATAIPIARSRQILELSTMTREGDREVIRTLPFGYVNMLLAARHQASTDYPSFDPLNMFGDPADAEAASVEQQAAQIYGARVESELRLKVEPFAFDSASYQPGGEVGVAEAERAIRSVEPILSYEPVRVAALTMVDPLRFDLTSDAPDYEPGSAFRVIEENVSLAAPDGPETMPRFHEEIIPVRESAAIAAILDRNGHTEEEGAEATEALVELLGSEELTAGDALRVGVETTGETAHVVRLSAYRGDRHLATVAETEDGPFEPALAPELGDSVADAFDDNEDEAPLRADMPTVYDGIYQAGLAYGLNDRLCKQLLQMLASEVDLQSRLGPTDRLAAFFSLEKGEEVATDASEILFVDVRFGENTRRFYRFRPADSEAPDFFDEDGRSAKQFLLRKPLPKGRFTSSFSTGRKHPVLGYVRPHWGVDWAAPRGSPIQASGDGVIEKSGWFSGYGRQTVVRHANGYVTSYSHQSAIAKGIKPGVKVRQGQVIGYVGSTGLSTGNHLHYEVEVNGQKVDPMRIKLPSGTVLAGADLENFQRERKRIDNLLREQVESPLVAGR